jgi:hypothetical protein
MAALAMMVVIFVGISLVARRMLSYVDDHARSDVMVAGRQPGDPERSDGAASAQVDAGSSN